MRKSRSSFILSLLVAVPLAGIPRAWAGPIIYGSAHLGSSGAASLYSINPSAGAASLIGPIGFNRVGALDFDPGTGILYGEGKNSGGTDVLLTINPLTGVGTQVGPTGLNSTFQDIAFRRSDGKLFGYFESIIYTIDVTTGQATLVGSTGIPWLGGDALAFSAADTLYNANTTKLYTINQSTGNATFDVNLDFPFNKDRADAMKFDPGTGVLYASLTTGKGGPNDLATIDVNAGIVTEIGRTVDGLDAVAIPTVAEPSSLTHMMLGIGGALFGWRRLRQQLLRLA